MREAERRALDMRLKPDPDWPGWVSFAQFKHERQDDFMLKVRPASSKSPDLPRILFALPRQHGET